jgi:hypothetical protein
MKIRAIENLSLGTFKPRIFWYFQKIPFELLPSLQIRSVPWLKTLTGFTLFHEILWLRLKLIGLKAYVRALDIYTASPVLIIF